MAQKYHSTVLVQLQQHNANTTLLTEQEIHYKITFPIRQHHVQDYAPIYNRKGNIQT